MANEIQVRSDLKISNGSLQFQSRPTSFRADMASGAVGPAPGVVLVNTRFVGGTDIDLSALRSLGLCQFQNQDSTNTIHIGRFDPEIDRFYPMLKLLAGESYVLRLDDDILEEYTGTATGTTAAATTLRAWAEGAASYLLVAAFEA
jgi:hypothetical protein